MKFLLFLLIALCLLLVIDYYRRRRLQHNYRNAITTVEKKLKGAELVERSVTLKKLQIKIKYTLMAINANSESSNDLLSMNILIYLMYILPVFSLFAFLLPSKFYYGFMYIFLFASIVMLLFGTIQNIASTRMARQLSKLYRFTVEKIEYHNNIITLLNTIKPELDKFLRRDIDELINILKRDNDNDVYYKIKDISKMYEIDLFTRYLYLCVDAREKGITKELIEIFDRLALNIDISKEFLIRKKGQVNAFLSLVVVMSIVGIFLGDYFLDFMNIQLDNLLVVGDTDKFILNAADIGMFATCVYSFFSLNKFKKIG